MSDDLIAKMIARSNTALVATLAEALQGIRAPFVPSLKLCRFMGYPERVGDPTVAEWLHEFEMYARQTGVKDADRAVELLYPLGGLAREEGTVSARPSTPRLQGIGCFASAAFWSARDGTFTPHSIPCTNAIGK